MRIYLSDQVQKLNEHLQLLKSASVMPYAKEKMKEKVTIIPLNVRTALQDIDLDFFFDYKLFPKNILIAYAQWEHEGRQMQVGDTIVQQVFLPPVSSLSVKMIFGVRIKEIISEPNKIGYSYETLEGHVEIGISIFTIEENSGGLTFKIHTYSTPGNIFSRIAAPIFSLPYQAYCTRMALLNVQAQLK